MDINHLISLSNIAKESVSQTRRKRFLLPEVISHQDRTYLGILGPRGVGKTVLLRQAHAARGDSLYISLDTLPPETDLFELLQTLSNEYQFKTFFLDEVHFLSSFTAELKKIFDFLHVKVVFTSSVSLKLIESAHDLSRRIKILLLPPFSFREFLSFYDYPSPPPLSWESFLAGDFSAEHSAAIPYLKEYLSGGNYPFSLEVKDTKSAFRQNVEKIIRSDIPRLKMLTIEELDILPKVLQFIARAPVSDINPTSISKNLKVSRYKADQYVELFEKAFILKRVWPLGTNVTKEPKVLMAPPYRLLETPYEDALGGLREDFVVDCLSRLDIPFSYLKTERGKKTPDYLLKSSEKIVLEVGGAGKGASQFKGLKDYDRRIILQDAPEGSRGGMPLALLGLVEDSLL